MGKLEKMMWERVAKKLGSCVMEMQILGWEYVDVIEIHSLLFGGEKRE